MELAEKEAPSLLRFFYAPPKPDPARLLSGWRMAAALSWYEFFATHRPFAARASQQVIRHFIEARGNLLRLLSTYTFSSCDIRDEEIGYTRGDADRSRLSFLYPHLRIQAGIATRDFDVHYAAADFRGTPGDLVDACLLYWSIGDNECMAAVMPAILSTLTGREDSGGHKAWLAWRLGQLSETNEYMWEHHLWQSRNADVLKLLLKKAAGRKEIVPEQTLRAIITDRQSATRRPRGRHRRPALPSRQAVPPGTRRCPGRSRPRPASPVPAGLRSHLPLLQPRRHAREPACDRQSSQPPP